MRLALTALLACAACNQIFDLKSAELVDAGHEFFDAKPEPPTCPAIGTPLVFGTQLTQAVHQNCDQYMPSFGVGLAVATCYDEQYRGYLAEGALDGELAPLKSDLTCMTGVQYCYLVRLAPEGEDLFVYYYDYPSSQYVFDRYRRGPDGVWKVAAPVTFPATAALMSADMISQPTRRTPVAPKRHIISYEYTANPIHEYVADDTDSVWTDTGVSYSLDDLGTSGFGYPRLTEDGLRLLFRGEVIGTSTYVTMVAERDTIDAKFRPAVPVAGLPDITEALLSPDCERMYFPALNSIFYQTRKH